MLPNWHCKIDFNFFQKVTNLQAVYQVEEVLSGRAQRELNTLSKRWQKRQTANQLLLSPQLSKCKIEQPYVYTTIKVGLTSVVSEIYNDSKN